MKVPDSSFNKADTSLNSLYVLKPEKKKKFCSKAEDNSKGTCCVKEVFKACLKTEEREFYTSNVTGLAEVKDNEFVFKLYPNPANEQVNVVFSNLDERAILSVFDLQGRLVAKQDIAKDQKATRIDVSNLNAGMYYIKLQGLKTNKVEKLIKK